MSRYDDADSAGRSGRYRDHKAGDHSGCLYRTCKQRRDQEYAIQETIFTIEVFKELTRLSIPAKQFFGDELKAARAIARRTFADALTDYVRGDNLLIPLQAKQAVNLSLIERSETF
jgi:hypothetical protein